LGLPTAYQCPTHVYRLDSCPAGLGGYSNKGFAWRLLDLSSHPGKRSYLPWEWKFPCRHTPPTLAARLGLDLPPLAIALIGAHREVCHHTSQKAHYFAYQLNSKANQHLATHQCLALISSNHTPKQTNQVLLRRNPPGSLTNLAPTTKTQGRKSILGQRKQDPGKKHHTTSSNYHAFHPQASRNHRI
jgi:hypothetical protein